MALRTIVASVLLVGMTALASAHGTKGPNGGAQADAGDFHVEVLAQSNTLQVFLTDHADKAVPTAGYKGTAIFVIGGKAQRIPLTPAGENKLTGTSAVPIPPEPRGAVQLTAPSGSTVQAKFN